MPPKRKTQDEDGDAKTTPVPAEKRDDGGEEEVPAAAAASACKRSSKDENEQATTSGPNETNDLASSPPAPAYDYDLLWECVGMLAEGDPQELSREAAGLLQPAGPAHAGGHRRRATGRRRRGAGLARRPR
jgi:hypothetical protein